MPFGRPGANVARGKLARLLGQGGNWKSMQVVRTEPGAHHYRLQFLEIDGTANVGVRLHDTRRGTGADHRETLRRWLDTFPATDQLGEHWLDPDRRSIPDHWHVHARPQGRFHGWR